MEKIFSFAWKGKRGIDLEEKENGHEENGEESDENKEKDKEKEKEDKTKPHVRKS